MSKAADLNNDEYESANLNGSPEKNIDTVEDDEGEESDDYEEIDDEEIAEEDEDEGEGEGGQQNTLTHLLIGNPNGATSAENKAEYEDDDEDDDEVDGDDDRDDDDDDDDDDGDEYVEAGEEDPIPLNKKRSIDEVVEKEASQGSKKIKA